MMQVIPWLRSGVEQISRVPWAFDALRWMLEGGYRQHRQLLAQHFAQPPERVLDCGCGTGTFARCFPAESYFGIDISAAYIARARQRHPEHRFDVMDATQLDFADDSFDAVIVCGVIHHLDQSIAQRMLSEIARVLRPEGRLLLWEDVPTRTRLNLIGRLVHQLDVGPHIRPESEYAQLLKPHFALDATQGLRSGFMDYTAFVARKSDSAISACPIPTAIPASCAPDSPLPASDLLAGRAGR